MIDRLWCVSKRAKPLDVPARNMKLELWELPGRLIIDRLAQNFAQQGEINEKV